MSRTRIHARAVASGFRDGTPDCILRFAMYAPSDIFEAVLRETDAAKPVALCVIVATRGSTPQPAGAMLCVDQAASLIGTLGGGCVEADVRRRAHAVLTEAASRSDEAGAGRPDGTLLTFKLDHDFGHDDGMICGGEMDVAVVILASPEQARPFRSALDNLRSGRPAEVPLRIAAPGGLVEYRLSIEAEPKLVIVGAGHISRLLAGSAARLGFHVHVIDDRADYANADRFPEPIRTTVGDIPGTLRSWPVRPDTYFVIVTRGHKHDEQALAAVIDSPAAYIGMIGSRRKIDVIFDDLRHEGVSDESLARVRAPIGVDIGAVTTEEIALSIAAELVSVRRATHRRPVEGPTPVADEGP